MNVQFNTSKNRSIVNNGLPFVFLALIFAEIFWSFKFGKDSRFIIYWISGLLLFNVTHILLTFFNIIYLPEYRFILKQQRRLILTHAIVIVTFILLFAMNRKLGFFYSESIVRYVLVFIVFLAPGWHVLRQSMGLSLQINEKFRSNLQLTKASFFTASRLEKIAVGALILCYVPKLVLFYDKEFQLQFPHQLIYWFIGLLISVFVICFTFSLVKISDIEFTKKKIVFATRYVVHAFAPFTFLGRIGSASIHGVEYTLFQESVLANSQVSKKIFKIYVWVIVFVSAIYGLISFYHGFLRNYGYPKFSQFVYTGELVVFVLTYYHYYLDSKLFQMNDPKIRNTMAPLLRNSF